MSNMENRKQAFCGFMMMLFLGVGYTWPIFETPLENTFGWTRSQTSLAYSLMIMFFSIGILLGGKIIKKVSYRWVVRVSGCFMFLGFWLTTMITHIMQLYITFSFLIGINIGICYNIVLSVVPLWYPESTGKITGVLVMGYALSTSILSPLCKWMINVHGWHAAFFLAGILAFIAVEVGANILKQPNQRNEKCQMIAEKNEFMVCEIIKTKTFYLFFLFIILLGGVGLSFMNHLELALDAEFCIASYASILLSVFSLCNGVGRVVLGIYYDKTTMKKFLISISISYLIFTNLTLFGMYHQMFLLTAISGCCLIFAYGGLCMAIPAVTRGLFGTIHFSENYALCNMATVIGALIPSVVGLLFDIWKNYSIPFLLLGILCMAACIVSFFIKQPSKD